VNILNTDIDSRFQEHFCKLQQVFLSITNNCNLRCKHCLYKPWLSDKDGDMPYQIASSLAFAFKKMGAIKITLLGGEPTLYGEDHDTNDLRSLVMFLKDIGYKYIRLSTNGQFEPSDDMLYTLSLFDEVSFSFDGIKEDSHDIIRGKGTFEKAYNNLLKLINLNINVHVTFTMNCFNIHDSSDGINSVNKSIEWAQKLGVKCVNFHPIFKMGISRDDWICNTYISVKDWISIYDFISRNVNDSKYLIDVRLPQRFVREDDFNSDTDYYSYCPVRLGERVEVHPNGQIQICALLKGTEYSVAKFYVEESKIRIKWTTNETNEIESHDFDSLKKHPCAIIKCKNLDYVPLCISFKPHQKEHIWNHLNMP
jgi:MoaA/NifB/PqqE/SkfB family radical SAM enzyme